MQPANIVKSFAHGIFTENVTINEKRRTGKWWIDLVL
jgi:hypothetical protein